MKVLFVFTLLFICHPGTAQVTEKIAGELGYKVSLSKSKFYLVKDRKKEGPYDSLTVRYHQATVIRKYGEGVKKEQVNEPFLVAWSNGSFSVRSKYINISSITYFKPNSIILDTPANWRFSLSAGLHSIEPVLPEDADYQTWRSLPSVYEIKDGCIHIAKREYDVGYLPICGVDAIIATPRLVGVRIDEKGRKTFHRLSRLRLYGGPIISGPYDSVFTAYGEMVGCINKQKGTVAFFIQDSLFLEGGIAQISPLTASAKAMEISYWQQRDVAEQNDKRRKDSIDKSVWNWYTRITMFAAPNGGIGMLNDKGDTLLPAAARSFRMFGYIYKNVDGKVKPELMYGEKGENIVFWADNKLRLKERIGNEELRVEFYPVDRKYGKDVGYFFATMTPGFNYREVYAGTGTCGLCNGEKTVSKGVETEWRYRVSTETVKTGTATSVKKYSERTVTDANGKTYNYTPTTTEETDLYKTQTSVKKETYSVEKKVSCPRCNGTGDVQCMYLKYDPVRNEYIYFPRQ